MVLVFVDSDWVSYFGTGLTSTMWLMLYSWFITPWNIVRHRFHRPNSYCSEFFTNLSNRGPTSISASVAMVPGGRSYPLRSAFLRWNMMIYLWKLWVDQDIPRLRYGKSRVLLWAKKTISVASFKSKLLVYQRTKKVDFRSKLWKRYWRVASCKRLHFDVVLTHHESTSCSNGKHMGLSGFSTSLLVYPNV